MQKLRSHYSLIKPLVTFSNALTAVTGFIFASLTIGYSLNPILLLITFTGITLVIASACTLNNYLDRDIDKLMLRTHNRSSVTGDVKPSHIVWQSLLLFLAGNLLLVRYTNLKVTVIGLIGFITYVLLYGMLSKRLSPHGTLVGAISGATPILAGYVAVTNTIDLPAIILFLILFLWQFAAFYSIAIYRRQEYELAQIPLMPIAQGSPKTKQLISLNVVLCCLFLLLLSLYGYTSLSYSVIVLSMAMIWLAISRRGTPLKEGSKAEIKWARQMFKTSLIVLVVISVVIPISPLLP